MSTTTASQLNSVDIDVGGTFTDCVLTLDGRRVIGKAPTTPYDLSVCFMNAIEEVAAEAGAEVEDLLPRLDVVRYSTTVAMNRLIERRGPRVGLITTEGQEDAILIGRGAQWIDGKRLDERRNLATQRKPVPIVDRTMIVGVKERIDSTGAVLRPLDEDDVRRKLRVLMDRGARSIVVSLLWSFANPAHELRVKEIIREEYKEYHIGYLPVILSHQVVAKLGEYERTMTAAPDTELVENEFPLFIPVSSHWKDSAGHGKYRGGVGTAQLWVAHHVPMVFMMSIADNSKVQTPQGLFGGYAPCTIPGVSVSGADLMQQLREGRAIDLDITEVLRTRSVGGQWGNEFQGRAPRPYMQNDVITVAFATGGAGYGDPLERDPQAVGDDIDKGLVSQWAAEHIYRVAYDPERHRVDGPETERLRAEERQARLARGRPYAEFEAEWLQRKPPEEILANYGSWPDARPLQPLMRP